jgi:site-specific DNA recombinase
MNRYHRQPHLPTENPHGRLRAALYMRVSTGRQAEHDLSIPDQRNQLKSWCRVNGHVVVAEFVEAGASAGDDRRPAFLQMIERACDGEHAFDLIVVHSYSRFFREAFEQEFYLRRLAKHGVRVVSITQPVGDETEPVHAMMRKVIALFDEYQSKENAKHVIRSMKENARQGFWNGATPPLGYKLVEAEKRGTKIKKKLDIDPVEAETVRLIFKLYLHGDSASGALGVKENVKWLNARGHRTRRGKTFSVGLVHKLLTNTVYIGRWRFNQTSSRTRKRKADNEVVEIPVPAIIKADTFEQVQRQLHARSPKAQAPRVTTGPILLTGLAICATCWGGMTLRTGTSKGGRVYRYYTCSNCATKGKTACKGRSIPMQKLDTLVTEHLMERLFKPERVAAILAHCHPVARKMRQRSKAHSASQIQIDPALIERFGHTMRENFSTGSVPFRKAYLRSLIDVIEVDDHRIRIKGSKDLLEKAVLASQNGPPGCSQVSIRWRARRDSNS